MDENYLNMMRQTLKASGLSDAQIEQTLEAQKAAMQMYGNMDSAALQQAAAGMEGYMKGMAAAFGDSGADSYFEFA
ncbi:MAG: hypothetical protein LBG43_06495, partial [Treponema sp.]|nr:hypothetical protein [Treponema sp.]